MRRAVTLFMLLGGITLIAAGVLLLELRDPAVQTKVVQNISSWVARKTQAQIELTSAEIRIFRSVQLHNVLVRDESGDTLLYAKHLKASLNLLRAAVGGIRLHSLELTQGIIKLKREQENGPWNFDFIIKALSKPKATEKKPARLQLKELALQQLRFHMEDVPNHTRLDFFLPRLDLAVEHMDLNQPLFAIRHLVLDQPKLHVIKTTGEADPIIPDTGIIHLNTTPLRLRMHRLELINAMFRYDDDDAQPRSDRFDGLHQSYQQLNLRILNGAFLQDRIEAYIDQLQFREKSGLQVRSLRGQALVTPQQAALHGFELLTPYSRISDSLTFSYKNFHAFYDFTENVVLTARLNNTSVGLPDLARFGFPLPLATQPIEISGTFSGPVANFDVYDLRLRAGRLSRFEGHASFNGLPRWEQTFIALRAEKLITDAADLQRITGNEQLGQRLQQAGTLFFQGSFLGFPNDFVAYGTFQTHLGTLRSDLNMKLAGAAQRPTYSGTLSTEGFDLGKLLNRSDLLGTITLNMQVNGSGLDLSTVEAHLNGRIDQLRLNNYDYSGIRVDGLLRQQQFDGQLAVNDPNLQLTFAGLINLSDTLPAYRFSAQLQHANLDRLGLAKQPLSMGMQVAMDLRGRSLDDLSGSLQAFALQGWRKDQAVQLDSLHVVMSTGGQHAYRHLSVRSSVFQANINGRFAPTRLIPELLRVLHHHVPLVPLPSTAGLSQDFTFELNTGYISPILNFFVPSIVGFDHAALTGRFLSDDHMLSLSGSIPQLQFGSMHLGAITVHSKSVADSLVVYVGSNSWRIGDTLRIAKPGITLRLSQGGGLLVFSAHSHDYKSLLQQPVAVNTDSEQLVMRLLPGIMRINGIEWQVSSGNSIRYHDQRLWFNDFVLTSGFRLLQIQNINPRVRATNIRLQFHQIPLEDFPQLTRIGQWHFSGNMSGSAEVFNVFHQPRVNASLNISSFGINQATIRQASIHVVYVPEVDALELNAVFSDEHYDIAISGNYFPKRTKRQLDIDLRIEKANMALAEALFFRDLISGTSGVTSGRLRMTGTLQQPQLTGRLEITAFRTTVNYLKTTYTSPAFTLRFRDSAIELGQILLYDRFGDSALITGQIPHRHLDDWQLQVRLQTARFLLLQTTAADDSLFYGTAVASGMLTFRGPATAPEIVADMRTERGTRISIPIYSSSSVATHSFVEFRNPKAPRTTLPASSAPIQSLSMAFNVEVTPDAQFRLIFDEKTGDIIEASGTGNLRMEVVLPEVFNMYGRLQIEQGQYLFTQYNFFNKYFTIDPGGTIEWNGDPYEARLNISAVYSTRTSLDALLTDVAVVTEQDRRELRQRQAVDLYLMLSGPLSAPEVRFDIRLPEASGASNTANLILMRIRQDENELNKQVFGILVLGHFLPPSPDASSSGLGTEVNNNLSEFLFNQLSYLASSIRSDVDLNVSYQTYEANINPSDPADLVRRNELQVALTKRFFDDRLALDVGGNFDFGGTGVEQPPTGIAGDFMVDYKITPDGRLRARVFSKSDYDAIDERVKTRNGIGIRLSRDFNTVSELFRKKEEPLTVQPEPANPRRLGANRRSGRSTRH
ncbi:MAG: translocation/assembly module TamB domain-containing protein [Chitinophagales bacterium]|nr:translocation/assembly module TamB domain-containing protein [Chitinophagales bacterium]MDW8428472.1 translocation/assembly module TamB domain-containing protein [Chitinophagales bacterium]